MRKEIIDIARGELGYVEGANNKTKYGAEYGLDLNPWCLMFVWWCARRAGISGDVIPKIASCSACVNWFRQRGRWKPQGTYTPIAGDIVFFDFDGGTADHVGFVESAANGTLVSIEGNTGDAVRRRTRSLSDRTILGYAVPAYSEDANVPSSTVDSESQRVIELQRALNADFSAGLDVDGEIGPLTRAAMKKHLIRSGSRGETVRWAQARLIELGFPCGKYGADGIFGQATLAATLDFQRSRSLLADGVIGIDTYSALLA